MNTVREQKSKLERTLSPKEAKIILEQAMRLFRNLPDARLNMASTATAGLLMPSIYRLTLSTIVRAGEFEKYRNYLDKIGKEIDNKINYGGFL